MGYLVRISLLHIFSKKYVSNKSLPNGRHRRKDVMSVPQNKKFIAKEKMSKNVQADLAKSRRGSWNGVNPVTRVVLSSRKAKLEKIRQRESKRY